MWQSHVQTPFFSALVSGRTKGRRQPQQSWKGKEVTGKQSWRTLMVMEVRQMVWCWWFHNWQVLQKSSGLTWGSDLLFPQKSHLTQPSSMIRSRSVRQTGSPGVNSVLIFKRYIEHSWCAGHSASFLYTSEKIFTVSNHQNVCNYSFSRCETDLGQF